jgi:hypothetical protein
MKARRLFYLIFICLFCVGGEKVSRSQGQPGPSKAFLSSLSQPTKLRSIEMEDDWMGLSELGPLRKRYLLKPGGQQLTGTATFTLGAGPLQKIKEEPISIPNEMIQSFLSLLSQSTFEEGEYKPRITHTDDYPSRRIEITSENGKLVFFSTSQGELAVPWGASFENKSFIVNSGNPGEAMAKIRPYLKDEAFKKFEEEILAQTRKARKH